MARGSAIRRGALLVVALVAVAVVGAFVVREWHGGTGAGEPAPAPSARSAPSAGVAGDPRFEVARGRLAALPVGGRDPAADFDRSRFGKAWSDEVDVEFGRNGCNTRDDVLRRDLTDLTVRPGTCFAQSGTLHDPYTGATIEFVRGPETSDAVQIDHVVSLADAWYKGASQWDSQRLLDFANDPRNLLAVSPKANFDKAFRDAAGWLPPAVAFRCDFVARQIDVKTAYGLRVSAREKQAMADVLARC